MSGRKPLSATSFPVGLYAALPASPAFSVPGSGRFFGTAVVVVWGDFASGLLPLLQPAARTIATSAHASAWRQRSCMGGTVPSEEAGEAVGMVIRRPELG